MSLAVHHYSGQWLTRPLLLSSPCCAAVRGQAVSTPILRVQAVRPGTPGRPVNTGGVLLNGGDLSHAFVEPSLCT